MIVDNLTEQVRRNERRQCRQEDEGSIHSHKNSRIGEKATDPFATVRRCPSPYQTRHAFAETIGLAAGHPNAF